MMPVLRSASSAASPADEATPRTMPHLDDETLAMVDGGGTQMTMVVYRKGGGVSFRQTYRTHQFDSLTNALRKAFRDSYRTTGRIPGRIAFALSGPADEEKGIVRLTNPPKHWPVFNLGQFMEETGCRGRLFNDMEVQAADAISTPRELLRVLRQGHTWRDGDVLLISDSTGLGVGRARQGFTTKLEGGHIELGAHSEEEKDYIEFTALLTGLAYPSAETLISGRHGFQNLIDWLLTMGSVPDASTQASLESLGEDDDPGPVISQRVGKDPFANTIIRVMGGLYGTWLRMMMTEHQPTGGVHLVGGVNMALAHVFADRTFSPFLERINAEGPHHDRVRTFEVAVNRDRTLTERGGFILAQQV